MKVDSPRSKFVVLILYAMCATVPLEGPRWDLYASEELLRGCGVVG